jgi:ADP-ribosyl-[dinitrogen reductase] hydrolase
MDRNRVIGCLVGLACGDATGTTLEFMSKGTFKPITDMTGGGYFNLKKGEWTDDTSMALCLAHSLVFKKGFDPVDQMNRYCNWRNYGCFDIGITVSKALNDYLASGEPFSGVTDEFSSGNGGLMRLAPVPMFYRNSPNLAIEVAAESTRTTHGSELCIDSSKLFCELLIRAMYYNDKDEVLSIEYSPLTEAVRHIANRSYLDMDYKALTGSGFVIESLISALWCFYHGTSFKECVLLAANLGNDADTTAAICGQIAGAYYGFEGIPNDWVESLTESKEIINLADALFQIGSQLD